MTAFDGGGVAHDVPLPEGTRIRFRLGIAGRHDVCAYLEDGVLHIVGQYLPLATVLTEVNHLEVRVISLG